MTPSSHPDRILRALARATTAESPALTWLELNAELPSMAAGDLTVMQQHCTEATAGR